MKTLLTSILLALTFFCSAQSRWQFMSLLTVTPDNAANDVTIFVTCGQDTIFYYDQFQTMDGQYAIGFTMPTDKCCEIHFRNPQGTGMGNGGNFILYNVESWIQLTGSPINLTYSFDAPICICSECNESTNQSSCPTDINNDGITNVTDLSLFLSEFGNSCN
jgi:hypothetical protein